MNCGDHIVRPARPALFAIGGADQTAFERIAVYIRRGDNAASTPRSRPQRRPEYEAPAALHMARQGADFHTRGLTLCVSLGRERQTTDQQGERNKAFHFNSNNCAPPHLPFKTVDKRLGHGESCGGGDQKSQLESSSRFKSANTARNSSNAATCIRVVRLGAAAYSARARSRR